MGSLFSSKSTRSRSVQPLSHTTESTRHAHNARTQQQQEKEKKKKKKNTTKVERTRTTPPLAGPAADPRCLPAIGTTTASPAVRRPAAGVVRTAWCAAIRHTKKQKQKQKQNKNKKHQTNAKHRDPHAKGRHRDTAAPQRHRSKPAIRTHTRVGHRGPAYFQKKEVSCPLSAAGASRAVLVVCVSCASACFVVLCGCIRALFPSLCSDALCCWHLHPSRVVVVCAALCAVPSASLSTTSQAVRQSK